MQIMQMRGLTPLTQYSSKYINQVTMVNLQQGPMRAYSSAGNMPMTIKNLVPKAILITLSEPQPDFNIFGGFKLKKTFNKATNLASHIHMLAGSFR